MAVLVYAGRGTHSSVERAVFLAGIAGNTYVIIESTNGEEGKNEGTRCINVKSLNEAIQLDRERGFLHVAVIVVFKSRSMCKNDDVDKLLCVAKEWSLLTYVDTAWVRPTLIYSELRTDVAIPSDPTENPLDLTYSVAINPQKWLLTI